MRLRLLHVAGRIVTTGRRHLLRRPRGWPWAELIIGEHARLARLHALPDTDPHPRRAHPGEPATTAPEPAHATNRQHRTGINQNPSDQDHERSRLVDSGACRPPRFMR
jgi:hypothetical protein